MKPIGLGLTVELLAAKTPMELDSMFHRAGIPALIRLTEEQLANMVAEADSSLDWEVYDNAAAYELAAPVPAWLLSRRFGSATWVTYASEPGMIQLTAIARGAYGVMPPTNG